MIPTWHHLIQDLVFNRYYEPFLGGGSTFFSLPDKHDSFLSDMNSDLIQTYKQVKDSPIEVYEAFSRLTNSEEMYYRIRARKCQTDITRAARFIYLNQTSYNGLYRVNLRGEYNVPYGFRTVDYKRERLELASSTLKRQNAQLKCCDFEQALEDVGERDLVFLDPPYTVSQGSDNGFIKYNEKIFSLNDQVRLSKCINRIAEKGAYYILTNAAHPTLEKIFKTDGGRLFHISRSSTIGGRNATRGAVTEFIFTNIRK